MEHTQPIEQSPQQRASNKFEAKTSAAYTIAALAGSVTLGNAAGKSWRHQEYLEETVARTTNTETLAVAQHALSYEQDQFMTNVGLTLALAVAAVGLGCKTGLAAWRAFKD